MVEDLGGHKGMMREARDEHQQETSTIPGMKGRGGVMSVKGLSSPYGSRNHSRSIKSCSQFLDLTGVAQWIEHCPEN